MTIAGSLSGSGKVQLGDNATLVMDGTAAGSTTVAFTGKQATLEIGSPGSGYGSSTTTPYAVSSRITGFAAGDSIVIDHLALSKATYASTGTNVGTLTLFQGTTAVETLRLTGASYTGSTFFISPTSNGGSATLLPQTSAAAKSSSTFAPASSKTASPQTTTSAAKAPASPQLGSGSDSFVFQPIAGQEHMVQTQMNQSARDPLPSSAFSSLVDVLHQTDSLGGWPAFDGPHMQNTTLDHWFAAHHDHGALAASAST